MQKYLKGILFIVGAVALLIIGLVLKNTDYAGYAILGFTGAGILCVLGVFSLFTSSNPTKLYDSKVRNLLNTYDSILVQSNSVPSLEGRNIVNLERMEDLVDAQLELRKPICYLKQTESCSFILLDEKEAYVYVEKLNDDVISPVEIELNNLRIKEKDKDDMDSEMLKGIDKTTIVKLSNRKSYKVSPVRKKTVENTEEEKTEEVKEEEKAQEPENVEMHPVNDNLVQPEVEKEDEYKFQINPEEIAKAQEEINVEGTTEPSNEEVVEKKESHIREDEEII